MIFREYVVNEDGSFHQEMLTRLCGFLNSYTKAEEVLQQIGEDRFPVIGFEEIDDEDPNLGENYRDCLRCLFMTKQVEFFLRKGWTVRLVNIDNIDKRMSFTKKTSVEIETQCIMNALIVSRCSFWVEGFSPKCLLIHTSKSSTRSDALCVA